LALFGRAGLYCLRFGDEYYSNTKNKNLSIGEISGQSERRTITGEIRVELSVAVPVRVA
jgi:hypothetical protein